MQFQGKEVIFWSANDYLGLCNHPEVKEADAKSAAEYGMFYPMGARAMSGETDQHLQLEKNWLNSFKRKRISVEFRISGYGFYYRCPVNRNDVIVYDMDSHACIVDGVRLHSGKRFTYKHNDMESLEKNLQRANKVAQENNGGILVITEGVLG